MPGDYLYTHQRDGTEVLVLDVADGTQVDTIDPGGTVKATFVDIDDNIYVGLDNNGETVKYDSDHNELWRWSDGWNPTSKFFIWPEKGHLYVGEGGRFHALDIETGDHFWTNYEPDDEVMDFTLDGQYIYVTGYGEDEIFRIDPSDGSTVGEWDPELPECEGMTIYDGEWIINFDVTYVKKYDEWQGSETGHYDPPEDGFSNLVVDNNGIVYGGTVDADIFAIDSADMSEVWLKDLESSGTNAWISSVSMTPTGYVFANDRDEETTYGLDTDDGTILWQRDDIGFWIYESFSAYPQLESYSEEEWLPSISLSGTAELQDDPVENAEIIVIDDEEDEFVARTQSDVDGNWSVEAPDSTLHVIAQYTDENGELYNAESYPYVTDE